MAEIRKPCSVFFSLFYEADFFFFFLVVMFFAVIPFSGRVFWGLGAKGPSPKKRNIGETVCYTGCM